MSPDSPESRISRLEQTVSALKQQMQDTVEDVRAFGPLIAAQAETRATMAHIVADLAAMTMQVAKLERQIAEETQNRKVEVDQDRRDRRQGQEARQREDKTNRTLLWVAAIGLVGTLLLAIAAVLAAVL